MLCSECYQEIKQGKEIQVKGTIFCENCVKKDDELIKKEIVAICRKCCKPIYNNKKKLWGLSVLKYWRWKQVNKFNYMSFVLSKMTG